MENQELFGKLFDTIPLVSEDHLNMVLQTMDKNESTYILIQAVNYAYRSGVYSLGESEVISKAIRTVSRKEEENNDTEKN